MNILTQKKCSACGEWKDKSEFHKNKSQKDGLHHTCKTCKAQRALVYRSTHAEDERQRMRNWRAANPEKRKAQDKRYLSTHLEEERERHRKWAEENPGKVKEKTRRWALANPDKRKESFRAWRSRNKETVKKWLRKWYEKNKAIVSLKNREKYARNAEVERQKSRDWRKSKPEAARMQRRNRRARERAAIGTITAQEWRALKAFYNYTCLCCKRQEPEIRLTLDHVKPLIRGGSNTINNAQPLCLTCNSSKGTKEIDYR